MPNDLQAELRARKKVALLLEIVSRPVPFTADQWHDIAHQARDLCAIAIPRASGHRSKK